MLARPLAAAFFDDPVFRWVIPDDARRGDMLPAFFELFADMLIPHGESYTTLDGQGSALWVPPNTPPVSEDLADAFGQRMAEIVGGDAERMTEVSVLIDEHHPAGGYYYLQFLGVAPEIQGQGVGSALLSDMLERCHREGFSAYLDATSPRNRTFYERHGFRAAGEFAPAGGPALWPMWWDPRT